MKDSIEITADQMKTFVKYQLNFGAIIARSFGDKTSADARARMIPIFNAAIDELFMCMPEDKIKSADL